MSWITILTLLAYIIYIAYTIAVAGFFGIPHSLSRTYYLFKQKSNWLKVLFPAMMVSMACLLMPAWIELSEGSNFQFMSFLACAGLVFTGIFPAFQDSKHENIVHTISAYFAVVMALLWIVLVTNLWWVIFIWIGIIGIVGFVTKSWKSSYTYWLETITIMSTINVIICFS